MGSADTAAIATKLRIRTQKTFILNSVLTLAAQCKLENEKYEVMASSKHENGPEPLKLSGNVLAAITPMVFCVNSF